MSTATLCPPEVIQTCWQDTPLLHLSHFSCPNMSLPGLRVEGQQPIQHQVVRRSLPNSGLNRHPNKQILLHSKSQTRLTSGPAVPGTQPLVAWLNTWDGPMGTI